MSYYGVSTIVSDKLMHDFKGTVQEFGAQVLNELCRSVAIRVIEDYQGAVQVIKHPSLRETEFQLNLNIFTNSQLDDYFKERLAAEKADANNLKWSNPEVPQL